MKVAVTGAFGFSGRFITHRLLERGHQLVTLTNRRPGAADPPIPAYPLDFEHPSRLVEALSGVEALFGHALLTPDELAGLMENLLVSAQPPRGQTPLTRWLRENREQVGKVYASELKRHYLP